MMHLSLLLLSILVPLASGIYGVATWQDCGQCKMLLYKFPPFSVCILMMILRTYL